MYSDTQGHILKYNTDTWNEDDLKLLKIKYFSNHLSGPNLKPKWMGQNKAFDSKVPRQKL